MTVAELEGEAALCIWFEKDQQRQQRFPVATIMPAQKSAGISFGVV